MWPLLPEIIGIAVGIFIVVSMAIGVIFLAQSLGARRRPREANRVSDRGRPSGIALTTWRSCKRANFLPLVCALITRWTLRRSTWC